MRLKSPDRLQQEAILDLLNDIETNPSPTVNREALRVRTLVSIINDMSIRDAEGSGFLAVKIDNETGAVVGFCANKNYSTKATR